MDVAIMSKYWVLQGKQENNTKTHKSVVEWMSKKDCHSGTIPRALYKYLTSILQTHWQKLDHTGQNNNSQQNLYAPSVCEFQCS